jgi:hypothetical protein
MGTSAFIVRCKERKRLNAEGAECKRGEGTETRSRMERSRLLDELLLTLGRMGVLLFRGGICGWRLYALHDVFVLFVGKDAD